jgi:hypothetical protein
LSTDRDGREGSLVLLDRGETIWSVALTDDVASLNYG